MLETPLSELQLPKDSPYKHVKPKYIAHKSNLDLPPRKFPAKRRFQFAVPNLRYGSGVRFELSNDFKKGQSIWSFKFFYGNSKNIKQINLDKKIKESLAPIVNTSHNEVFTECIDLISKKYKDFDSQAFQGKWISPDSNNEVFGFLDKVGECVEKILNEASYDNIDKSLLETIVKESNKKLNENLESLITGFYFLSSLNSKIFN